VKPVVHIVDDDAAVRDSLRWLIESPEYRVESHASAAGFLDRVTGEGPGCVLADVRMPRMSGLDLLAEMARRQSPLPVIVITGHGDVAMAVRAMKAGAFDFIEKPLDDEILLDLVGNAIAQSVRAFASTDARVQARHRLARLTPREREVLERIVRGAPNKAVAGALGISEKTVEAHRAHIMGKMEAVSFAELVRMTIAGDNSFGAPEEG